jgi:hypothetical protein
MRSWSRTTISNGRALLGHARASTTQAYTRIRPPQLKRPVSFYEEQATRWWPQRDAIELAEFKYVFHCALIMEAARRLARFRWLRRPALTDIERSEVRGRPPLVIAERDISRRQTDR